MPQHKQIYVRLFGMAINKMCGHNQIWIFLSLEHIVLYTELYAARFWCIVSLHIYTFIYLFVLICAIESISILFVFFFQAHCSPQYLSYIRHAYIYNSKSNHNILYACFGVNLSHLCAYVEKLARNRVCVSRIIFYAFFCETL